MVHPVSTVQEIAVLNGDTVRRFWIGQHDEYDRLSE